MLENMENKRKHLEFIQEAINRMAGNLFYLRGWTITLVAGLFALLVKNANHNFIFVVYFPVIIFWVLDGYFLSQERLFRSLYDDVRKLNEGKIDFSMDTGKYTKDENNSWVNAMFSSTLLFFYIPLIIIMLLVTYLVN